MEKVDFDPSDQRIFQDYSILLDVEAEIMPCMLIKKLKQLNDINENKYVSNFIKVLIDI